MQLEESEHKAALERILASPELATSPRMAQLLRYLVEETLAGHGPRLKETVIGVDVFTREPGYDPKIDPVVRVEVRRLRGKLLEYYDGSGKADPVRIDLPKGSYQAAFSSSAPVAPEPAPEPAPPPPPPAWRLWLLAAALLALTAVAVFQFSRRPEPIGAPRLITGHQEFSRTPVFSADGQALLFSRDGNGAWSHIYRQKVNGRESVAVTSGDVKDYEPAWAASGAIAFLREKPGGRYGLQYIATDGGAPREVAEVGIRSTLNFLPDGSALLVSDKEPGAGPARLVLIALADGRKTPLTNPENGWQGDQQARLQPGGSWVAFVRAKEASVQDVWRVPVTGGPAAPITTEKRLIAGLDWAEDGSHLLVAMSRGEEPRSLWRVHPDHGILGRVAEVGIGLLAPAVARKGSRLAYTTRLSDTNLWRADIGGASRALTTSIQMDTGPQISPDGKSIAFRSNRSGFDELWVSASDGTGLHKVTAMNGPTTGSARWSPDGTRLLLDSRPDGNGDIFVVPVQGGTPQPLTRDKSNEVLPSWSPDGAHVYFTSDRSGAWEVFRIPADGGTAEQITHTGASAGFVSPDGKYLYYVKRSGAGGVWRLPLQGTATEEQMAPLPTNLWGQWALGPKGLYYAVFGAPGERAIRRRDLATGAIRDVVKLDRLPVQFDSGMSIAPDESWLCWSQLDAAGSDIYLVENFR